MKHNLGRRLPMILLAAAVVIVGAALAWWLLGSKTGSLKIVDKTYCSDLCPEYERTYQVYEGVDTKTDCAKAGGQDIIDPAWGGYIGCAPNQP